MWRDFSECSQSVRALVTRDQLLVAPCSPQFTRRDRAAQPTGHQVPEFAEWRQP